VSKSSSVASQNEWKRRSGETRKMVDVSTISHYRTYRADFRFGRVDKFSNVGRYLGNILDGVNSCYCFVVASVGSLFCFI
jgi:hypothetical protein